MSRTKSSSTSPAAATDTRRAPPARLFEVFCLEAGKSVAVTDHDGERRRSGEPGPAFGAFVHGRADLGEYFVERQAHLVAHLETGHLAGEITPWSWHDTRT